MSSPQSSSRPVADPDDDLSLHSLAERTLRDALLSREWAAGENTELRRLIRVLADSARRRGLRAEQLVVTLREAWSTLPEVHAIPTPSRRVELAARVVSVCIDEYYLGVRQYGDGDGRNGETDRGADQSER